MGFTGSSACKEFACNAGDPSSIPGLGSSPGEEMGYPLQCSWAFLVAQTVKNLPAMQGTWVQSLGWKDPLEEGMATHSSILAWRIPWTKEPGGLQSMGSQRVRRDSATNTHTSPDFSSLLSSVTYSFALKHSSCSEQYISPSIFLCVCFLLEGVLWWNMHSPVYSAFSSVSQG